MESLLTISKSFIFDNRSRQRFSNSCHKPQPQVALSKQLTQQQEAIKTLEGELTLNNQQLNDINRKFNEALTSMNTNIAELERRIKKNIKQTEQQ
jgi:predicted  nucleic acid-binding Zn-ribbon protein